MNVLQTLAQAAGIAYAAGLNLYATIGVVEVFASLIPAVASIWDTLQSLIRPPAAAALAAAIAWHSDPIFVLVAAVVGGCLAVTTHTTKLGLRYAIDVSPEPMRNGLANLVELGLVATIALMLWQHPFITLFFALIVLVLIIAMVRLIWRTLRQVFAGRWVPRHGFLQDARTSDRLERRQED